VRSKNSKQKKNKILNEKRKMKKYMQRDSLKEYLKKVNNELEETKKRNFLLRIKSNSVVKFKQNRSTFLNTGTSNRTKFANWGTNARSRDFLIDKLSSPLPSFSENSTSAFGGSLILGKGAFGKIELCKITHMDLVVASKTISGTISDVKAEALVMQQVAGHKSFPYIYGIKEPGVLLMEFIGTIKCGSIAKGEPVTFYLRKKIIKVAQWFRIASELVQAVSFLHSKFILHNDIHGNNVLITEGKQVKLIDFGKCSLIQCPVTYNITVGSKEHEKYNKYHRHLAHELRNITGSTQTVLTDTYSVGYVLKNIGHYESNESLFNIGRKMQKNNPIERLTLQDSRLYFLKEQ